MLTKKNNLPANETVALTEEYGVVIQHKLPPKLEDLGSFDISYSIGNLHNLNAIIDFEASII